MTVTARVLQGRRLPQRHSITLAVHKQAGSSGTSRKCVGCFVQHARGAHTPAGAVSAAVKHQGAAFVSCPARNRVVATFNFTGGRSWTLRYKITVRMWWSEHTASAMRGVARQMYTPVQQAWASSRPPVRLLPPAAASTATAASVETSAVENF